MTPLRRLDAGDAEALHAVLVDGFGGTHGVRDRGALESALAHEAAGAFELAADCAQAIARRQPFVDGNHRAAFVIARVLLGINGQDLRAPEEEVVVMTVALATGELDVATYAAWLRKHSRTEAWRRALRKTSGKQAGQAARVRRPGSAGPR